MSEKNICKSCLESVIVTEDVIQELIMETEEDLSKIVSVDVYEARLKICGGCPSLLYGTTCSYSGSIVRYRAKFKSKSCPYPGGPKWLEFGC